MKAYAIVNVKGNTDVYGKKGKIVRKSQYSPLEIFLTRGTADLYRRGFHGHGDSDKDPLMKVVPIEIFMRKTK